AMTRQSRFSLTACAAIAALAAAFAPAPAADVLLSGTITSASGEAMGGVTVSAKADGGTITTTVFTDEAGGYYFPTLPGRENTGYGRRRSASRPPRARSISPPRGGRTSP